jgi:hypothetical protein
MNSFLLLVILGLSVVGLLSALIGSSPIFAFLTAGSGLVCLALLVLNRRGQGLLVGIIIWATLTAVLDLELFHLATVSPSAIPLFDLLVGNELLAALILPLPFLAVAACWNCVFVLVALALLPHTLFLQSVIAKSAAQLSLWSVALYVLVAVGIWLLVWMGEQMNPAAEVARLQQGLIDEQLARRHMEDSLRWMEERVGRVLNGDLSARIMLPEEEGTPGFSLALTLNQVLSRLQRLSQVQASHQAMLPLLAEQQSLEDMQVALDQDMVQVMQALRLAEAGQHPIRLGTPRVEELRPLFRVLHQKYLTPMPWS